MVANDTDGKKEPQLTFPEDQDGIVVIVGVGQSASTGDAIRKSLLENSRAFLVTAGRTALKPYSSRPDAEHHIQVDLTQESSEEELIEAVREIQKKTGKKVISIIHAIGPGYLEKDLEEDPAKRNEMERLNYGLPMALTQKMKESGLIDESTLVMGLGGLFELPQIQSVSTGAEDAYAKVKVRLKRNLPSVSPSKPVWITLGHLNTAMLGKVIGKSHAQAVWYVSRAANPYEGLGKALAHMAVNPEKYQGRTFILPDGAAQVAQIPPSVLRLGIATAIWISGEAIRDDNAVSEDTFQKILDTARKGGLFGQIGHWILSHVRLPLTLSRLITAKKDAGVSACTSLEAQLKNQ